MTTTYKFKFAFTKLGIGIAPSSAPVCTVVDSADNVLANAQATTALANMPGVYLYSYSGADGMDLIGLAHTSDVTVDQQDLYSYTPDILTTILDAAISSRSSHSAADVWAVATRTLTSFGALVTNLWAYATRTLTQSAAQVSAAVTGSTLSIKRGDTFVASLIGLGNISGRTGLHFTAKLHLEEDDSNALIQVSEAGGLLQLNGSPATASDGTLVVNDATLGNVTLTIKAAATYQLPILSDVAYDIQEITATQVNTLTESTLSIEEDVTRRVS